MIPDQNIWYHVVTVGGLISFKLAVKNYANENRDLREKLEYVRRKYEGKPKPEP